MTFFCIILTSDDGNRNMKTSTRQGSRFLTARLIEEESLNSEHFSFFNMGFHRLSDRAIINRPQNRDSHIFLMMYDKGYLDRCEIRPNTLIIWEPCHSHLYGNPDSAWENSWLSCTGGLIRKMLTENSIPLNQPIQLGDVHVHVYDKYMLDLYNELNYYRQPDPVILQNIIHTIIREIRRILDRDEANERIPKNLSEVKRYIDTNYMNPIAAGFLAEIAHISEIGRASCRERV